MMNIQQIQKTLDCHLQYSDDSLKEIEFAFASDLMSDVLFVEAPKMLLITGLATTQSIRTADVADIDCVVLVRGKKASPEMIELAKECRISLLESEMSMFKASAMLYQAGIKPIF